MYSYFRNDKPPPTEQWGLEQAWSQSLGPSSSSLLSDETELNESFAAPDLALQDNGNGSLRQAPQAGACETQIDSSMDAQPNLVFDALSFGTPDQIALRSNWSGHEGMHITQLNQPESVELYDSLNCEKPGSVEGDAVVGTAIPQPQVKAEAKRATSGSSSVIAVPRTRCECDHCHHTFCNKSSLTRHKRHKHQQTTGSRPKQCGPFICQCCQNEFSRYDVLKRHEKEQHSSDNPTCKFCKKSLSARAIRDHWESKLCKSVRKKIPDYITSMPLRSSLFGAGLKPAEEALSMALELCGMVFKRLQDAGETCPAVMPPDLISLRGMIIQTFSRVLQRDSLDGAIHQICLTVFILREIERRCGLPEDTQRHEAFIPYLRRFATGLTSPRRNTEFLIDAATYSANFSQLESLMKPEINRSATLACTYLWPFEDWGASRNTCGFFDSGLGLWWIEDVNNQSPYSLF